MNIITCLLALTVVCAAAEPNVSTIDYKDGDTALRGTLVIPAGVTPANKRPGVLVVHEWWGRNDYADRRAKELAEAGYIAFALDMYGVGKVTQDPKEAGTWAGPFYGDRELLLRRAKAGLAQLSQAKEVDGSRLAAIGFCFGGTVVLEMARAGEKLKAVASFHGGLKTTKPAAPGTILASVLVLHGGADSLVPVADVSAFMTEMTDAKANWKMEVYGSAKHAFTNPAARALAGKLPVDYDPEAEAASIAAMHALFKRLLAP
ncbi:MAG: dienelactone hydrolase family protein [Planctomycetota bacterium]